MSDKKTILCETHEALGARMVSFGGWLMPVQYPSGVKAEHAAVRNDVGIFDVSHMGNVILTGKDAGAALDHLTTWPMSTLKPGRAKYTVFPNTEGGVVDDLIVYRRGEDDYLIIWTAGNHDKNLRWVSPILADFDAALEDLTDDTALIAVQGPEWQSYYARALPGAPVPEKRFSFLEHDHMTIVRTGYTGEDGVEIWLPNRYALDVWQALLALGAQPCGLGARDSLRIEAGLPLYGHELSDTIGPFEAGVGFVLKKDDNRDYLGRAELDRDPDRMLVGICMVDKGVPREGYEVLDSDKNIIGHVTSGSYSPVLDKGIGLALVTKNETLYDGKTSDAFISIRGREAAVKLVKPPIHKAISDDHS